MSAAAMTTRPSVYASIQGRTRGGPGTELLSAMTAFPLGGTRTRRIVSTGVSSPMSTLPLGGTHNRRAGAGDAPDPVQRADGGLECRDVGHADLEHVSLAPGDAPAGLDLGQRPQFLL